jgi:hypothetical protein
MPPSLKLLYVMSIYASSFTLSMIYYSLKPFESLFLSNTFCFRCTCRCVVLTIGLSTPCTASWKDHQWRRQVNSRCSNGGNKYKIWYSDGLGRDKCGPSRFRSGPLAIHHYVGPWEYYSYKKDSRGVRRREDWETKSNVGEVRNDDEIRPWIGGFVNHVGEHLVKYLLDTLHPSHNCFGSGRNIPLEIPGKKGTRMAGMIVSTAMSIVSQSRAIMAPGCLSLFDNV